MWVTSKASRSLRARSQAAELFLDGTANPLRRSALLLDSKRRKSRLLPEVVQEYLDSLVRPASGTQRTYQSMLDLHIARSLGLWLWGS